MNVAKYSKGRILFPITGILKFVLVAVILAVVIGNYLGYNEYKSRQRILKQQVTVTVTYRGNGVYYFDTRGHNETAFADALVKFRALHPVILSVTRDDSGSYWIVTIPIK